MFVQSAIELISFDVFGTLISVRDGSYGAFERILATTSGGSAIDVRTIWEHWEECNIAAYWQPYRPYKEICASSLATTFAHFGMAEPSGLIRHYFDAFASFELYPDVIAALDRLGQHFRLALVSNIDDDLIAATPLLRDHGHRFELVCTAEQARGYKPDGTLFRHLLARAGLEPNRLLHAGQSQFTDMVGAKPLGLPVAWINRRGVALSPKVPRPDLILPDIASLPAILRLA